MQRYKKLKARILSLALSVAMVTTMMPATVFAAESDVPLGASSLGASSVGTIQSFEKLEDRFQPSTGEGAAKDVYALNVELNTPVEDLNLPDKLTAMVARTTTVSAPAEDEPVVDSGMPSEPAEDETIPDEDGVVEGDTATDGTVSGNQPATPSDAEEEVKEEIPDEDVPLAPEPDEETTVTTTGQETISVTWQSDKEYKSDENGKFIYTAVLPEGYILADGVKLPQIYVAVGKQARAGFDTYTVGIDGDYSTLKAAYEDSENVVHKTTLKLISDMQESGLSGSSISRVNIDLNGHTLSNNGSQPLFISGSAYIMNTGSPGSVINMNGQDLIGGSSGCSMSTSSQAAPITIKNSGSGGTIDVSSFEIRSGAYVILDQGVILESLVLLGMYLNIPSDSTLINNGTINSIPGGIVGTVKNGATGKIYINAGNVESIDNTTVGGKVYVTGGSIKSITETGNSGNVFYGESGTTPAVQYTFTLNNGTADLGDNILVNALTTTPSYTYGMDGVKTRDTGKIYIWVPSGLTGVNATVPSTAGADAGTYANAAISGAAATLTKGVEPAITVTINDTSYEGATLREAVGKLPGGAAAVTSLNITAGTVTEDDWNYLKNLTAMTSFEIDSAVDVADMPSTENSSLFPFSITTVTVPQEIAIGTMAFTDCAALTTASFPKATSIGGSAFNSCTVLTTANFSAAKSIGISAFYGCTALTTASFPKVTSIGQTAFKGCTELTTASFLKVTDIGISAFENCTKLTIASFPIVSNIGIGAFASCSKLATLKLGATPPTVDAMAFKDCPTARALGYLKADGTALTGTDLATAQAAYKAFDDGDITDNLWYGWTIVSAAPPTPPSGGGGGSDGGGSSTKPAPSGGTAGGITTPGKTVIDNPVGSTGSKNTLAEAVKNAVAAGQASATSTLNFGNYKALTKDGLKAINEAAAKAVAGKNIQINTKVQLDKKVGNAVVSRISIDPAKLAAVMPDKLGLGVWFDQKDKQVTSVTKMFEKAFDNKIVTVTFEQKSPLAVNMEFTAKPDLSALNTKSLYFYSYDPAKNIYNRIDKPNYWADSKGYSHITAPFGGSIIITDKPLIKK